MNKGILVTVLIVVAVAAFLLGRWTAPGSSESAAPASKVAAPAPAPAPAKPAPITQRPVAMPQAPAPVQPSTFRPASDSVPAVAIPPGTKPASDASPAKGPADAKVILHEVSDFQCPVCRRAYEPLRGLSEELQGQVRVVFKHNALEMHRNAMSAAAASMAAARQGKFDAYADILFENQRALSPEDLMGYAERLGMDMARFRKDYEDPALRARIQSEGNAASTLGARGTPAFFINGKQQVGWASYEAIKQMVTREIAEVDKLLAQGLSVADARILRVRANQPEADTFLTSPLGIEYGTP
jgi:protein-disulfide isomerase